MIHSPSCEPFVKDRGYRWELHIDDTPFDLGTVDGIFPPRPGSEIQNVWARDNKPSAFDYDSPDNTPTPPVAAE